MQKNLAIKSRDKKFNIYGVLDWKTKTDKLIIFVHGLTGHKNEHQFYNAANFFNDKNFTTFRFDLYTGKKGARKLDDCTISIHSEDLDQVIKYFINKFKEIYLIGHSLGGPTILGADLHNIKKIVLWDPAAKLDIENHKGEFSFNKRINAYIISWGPSFIISKEMINEWRNLDYKNWIMNTVAPLKIICAGKGILKNKWKKIIIKFRNENTLRVIKGAGHTFDEEDVETRLFAETLSWFK